MKLAGLRPVGAIAEVVAEDGSMMRLPGLIELGARDGVPVITIEQLIAHLNEIDPDGATPSAHRGRRVSLRADATVPTTHGTFRFLAYKDRVTGTDHIAVVSGELSETALVRVHSECLTGEAFGSLKCECGPQLDSALDAIEKEGGIVIYMRGHEGAGSASSTSCARTACRRRASTRSMPTSRWGCPPTPATTPRPPASSPTWACRRCVC